MQKYVLYYETISESKELPNHYIESYGDLDSACSRHYEILQKGIYKNVYLLKQISFKLTYSEVKEEENKS